MRMSDVFPSKYVKSADLGDKDSTVEIERVEVEEIGEDKRPVIYFRGKKKGLVCNKTNFNSISKLMGSEETDDWTGRSITLYATEVEYGGETVMGIRVRLRAPAVKPKMTPAPKADLSIKESDIPGEEEIPF